MAVKGKVKEKKEFSARELYVGFAQVKVVALNPTRAELSKIMGTEMNEEKEEFEYLTTDSAGLERLRLTFWLHDEENGKYFPHTFNIYNADRLTKDGKKVQIINSTLKTSWVPLKENEKGEMTDEADESLIQDWFLQFTNKEKEVIGKKKWRKALRGEEELGIFLKTWLSMQWYDPETEVMIDMKNLFKENYKELRGLIGDESMTNSFIALFGVQTNEEDPTKKYQEIFKKAYLPSGLMKYIKNGNKMPTDYTKKAWKAFTDEVIDPYGFNVFHKLKPLEVYNEKDDPVSTNAGKPKVEPQPADNEY